MSGNWAQHTGDDQLVHGLPKHMAAASSGWSPYWEYVPKPDACAKCQAMKGIKFKEKPNPVHPNCQCEIRQVAVPPVYLSGRLQGYEDSQTEKFSAGQTITVEVSNQGPFFAGAGILVDNEVWQGTSYLAPGKAEAFDFTKFGEPPIPWEVELSSRAGDNSTLIYIITG